MLFFLYSYIEHTALFRVCGSSGFTYLSTAFLSQFLAQKFLLYVYRQTVIMLFRYCYHNQLLQITIHSKPVTQGKYDHSNLTNVINLSYLHHTGLFLLEISILPLILRLIFSLIQRSQLCPEIWVSICPPSWIQSIVSHRYFKDIGWEAHPAV